MQRRQNQLDATEWFIAIIICSGTYMSIIRNSSICVITAYGVRWLAADCRTTGTEGRLCARIDGCCSSNIPLPDLRQPATKASHIIGANNTHIVSNS